MKIKKGGHTREVTQTQYNKKFKKMGYEIIEKVVELTIDDMTKNEIMEKLNVKGIKYDNRDKKEVLFDLLGVE